MNYNTSKTLEEQPHIINALKDELEKHEKYKELKQIGISFDDFSIIRAGEYIQKAKSGLNLYCIYLYDSSIEFDFNEDELPRFCNSHTNFDQRYVATKFL